MVLGEATVGIIDGTDDPCSDIGLSPHIVDDPIFNRIEEHTVEREVTSKSVFPFVGENNPVGMSSVGIGHVFSESSDFIPMIFNPNLGDSELRAYLASPWKKAGNLVLTGIGGHVIIARLDVHHHVANASPRKQSPKSVVPEDSDDFEGT